MLVVLSTLRSALAHEISPTEVFDLYQAYLQSCAKTSFSASFTDYVQGSSGEKNTLVMRWKIDFLGKQYKLEKPLSPDSQDEWQGHDENVFCNERYISVTAFPKQDEIVVISYVNTPDDYWKKYVRPMHFSYPFGYIVLLGELHYIPDMVSAGRKTVNISNDGKPVLTCETAAWKFVITLLPDKNYAAESIIAYQLKPVLNPQMVESFEYTAEHFIEKDGIWFSDKYKVKNILPEGSQKVNLPPGLHDSRADKDGVIKFSRRVVIAEVNFSEISFPKKMSDDDFLITIPIPDYTKVTMQDAPQIKYVWIDGKIEPLTDALAEERLRGHGFIPGTSSQWFSLIVGTAGFLMIVISIGIQIWRNLKKKKDNKKDEDK